MTFGLFQSGKLKTDIVVIIQIINANDFIATFKKSFTKMKADKAGGTGN